jgi:hypothetical protein
MCRTVRLGAGRIRTIFPTRPRKARNTMNHTLEKAFSVGKYLVSPLIRATESGRYMASVSIRNGMHDRVLRFVPEFSTRESALDYAVVEGRSWLQQRHSQA